MQLRNAPDRGHRSVAPQPCRLTGGNLPIYRTERYDLAYQRALRRSLSEASTWNQPAFTHCFPNANWSPSSNAFQSTAVHPALIRGDQGRVEFRPTRRFAPERSGLMGSCRRPPCASTYAICSILMRTVGGGCAKYLRQLLDRFTEICLLPGGLQCGREHR